MARSKGKTHFYIPGGKRDLNENDHQALIREVEEELTVNLIPRTIKYYGVFQAQADGKSIGQQVSMTCYTAEYDGGNIQSNSEIEEVAWVNNVDAAPLSKVTTTILSDLQKKKLVFSF